MSPRRKEFFYFLYHEQQTLVLVTVAYDAIETLGKTGKILGGCATYIGLAASHFNTECGLISIIGSDFEEEHLNLLKRKI